MKDTNINNKCEAENHNDKPTEINGPKGLEPTRYGKETPEWEKHGRVSDF